ncbi:MAG: FecR family protein [Devosia sp.]
MSRVLATIGRPLLLLVAMTLGSAGIATAADSIATAVGVKPQAQTLLGVENKVLVPNEALFEGQTISTGPYGQVQVLFADNTKMVVGPGSTLLIQKILMRNDGTASSFAVKALGGTYRFLTGNSKKQAYQINTPTGTIGVRGTEFDFVVDPVTGETRVILFSGQAIVCAESDACVTLSEVCGMASSTTREANLQDNDRMGLRKEGFPYVNGQQRLLRSFQVDDASECGQLVQQTFQSLSEPVTNPPAAVVPASTPSQNPVVEDDDNDPVIVCPPESFDYSDDSDDSDEGCECKWPH